jgi:hypothetical protein
VELWNEAGGYAGSSFADDQGHYLAGGLAPGTYYATTDSHGHLDELYDDLPCPDGGFYGCTPTAGTPILVTANDETSGVDFTLARLGTIAGTVTEAGTGEAVPFGYVDVWDAAGVFRGSGYIGSNGQYLTSGLVAGTYTATTATWDYLDELYDDLPCSGGAFYGCDPTAGTPIAVTWSTTTASIDFALVPRGSIAGRVIDSLTGEPASVYVVLWSASGQFVGYSYPDSLGAYSLRGLEPGTYYLTAEGFGDYAGELYEDLPCPGGGFGGCDPTTGTPLAVVNGQVTGPIDFKLDFVGSAIQGLVTAEETGAALAGVAIDLWSLAGQHLGTAVTGAAGAYRLFPWSGTYFVSTDAGLEVIDEVWENVACPAGSAFAGLCDPTTGTPVAVGAVASRVDFALGPDRIFADGFESGDLSAWSEVMP